LELRTCRLYLRAEHSIVTLGLIELLGGRCFFFEEAPCSFVISSSNVALYLKNRDLARHFVGAGAGCLSLCDNLLSLQCELRCVDERYHSSARKLSAFDGSKGHELPGRLSRDNYLDSFECPVCIRFVVATARRNSQRQANTNQGAHQRTSIPSVVRK
jgi:hypothetical protein